MTQIYDVCIIGAGLAGISTALKILDKDPNLKIKLFDLGRPPGKRRRQLEGWMGAFPAGDGKFYLNDIEKVSSKTNEKQTKLNYKWFSNSLKEAGELNIIHDELPLKRLQNKILKEGFEIKQNNYIQWIPDTIHQFSRVVAEKIKDKVELSCDDEITSIEKNGNEFKLTSQNSCTLCKNVVLAVGRSGWRWLKNVYKNLNLKIEDNHATFGIRVEIGSGQMEGFNNSTCLLLKDNLKIGPFSWQGTIIPEDHIDFAISAFRSNESRWKSKKVSFDIMRKIDFLNQGSIQVERLGQLAFVLFNDRVSKERIRIFMKDQSQLSLLPEFKWLKDDINLLNKFIPDLIAKANMYVPTIQPMAPQIELSENLESKEISGLFIAGESCGIVGLLSAALTGAIVGERICE
jgi:uncharacterized FAD-dependent dehydrogenase